MKRILTFFLTILIALPLLSGCAGADAGDKKVSVVCTNFAVYDWVHEIIGKGTRYNDKYEITLLTQGGDLHSYQPSVKDIAKVRTCDLLIYIGGASDIWVEEIVREEGVNSLKLFDLVKNELICTSHSHHSGERHNHNDADYDEHIWLSPQMASKCVDGLYEKLLEFADKNDADEGAHYDKNRMNYKAYCLEKLDKQYKELTEGVQNPTIIFADRFPFAYLMRDYGIEVISAFPGCSVDSNATFEVVAGLAKAVDDNNKKTVIVLENSDRTVAKTVIDSTKNKNAEIAVMNSCQSVGENEIKEGTNYFKIMKDNLESLKKALK